ncbi:MAG: hypothetical protein DRO39_05885 [Thermoprotei archaeon]|nr:MAG: hypothetical protein DRO39_05885 [Thermoprotei archaeon]
MSAAEKIYNILSTRQLLYVLLIIMVLIPLLHPFGIPISISSRVKAVYEYIEKLPDHPKVLIEIYYEPAAATELEPGLGAILRHLVKKHPKLVFVSLIATGPIMFESLKRYVPDVFKQLKYGEDYVYLGFLTGGEAACASLARGIKEFVPKDNYGNPTANMPIFKYADKAKDFDLVIIVSSGTDVFEWYVRQWYTPYHVPLLFVALSVIAPSIEPFVSAGQAIGMVVGQRGAAEYELLVGKPGSAMAAMDAQSFAHGLIITFIILGNIFYWIIRLQKKQAPAR